MTETYTVIWTDDLGTRQLPGCSEAEATFASEDEAEEAIENLITTDPVWGNAGLKIEPGSTVPENGGACRCDEIENAGALSVRHVPCPIHDDAIAAATQRAMRTTIR